MPKGGAGACVFVGNCEQRTMKCCVAGVSAFNISNSVRIVLIQKTEVNFFMGSEIRTFDAWTSLMNGATVAGNACLGRYSAFPRAYKARMIYYPHHGILGFCRGNFGKTS
jgi:hypothetical protein